MKTTAKKKKGPRPPVLYVYTSQRNKDFLRKKGGEQGMSMYLNKIIERERARAS